MALVLKSTARGVVSCQCRGIFIGRFSLKTSLEIMKITFIGAISKMEFYENNDNFQDGVFVVAFF